MSSIAPERRRLPARLAPVAFSFYMSALVSLMMGLTLTGESLNDLSDPRLRLRKRAKAGSGAVTSTSVIAVQQAAAAAGAAGNADSATREEGERS